MAWHLFGTKPLPEPMLTCCELEILDQTSVKSEAKYKIFFQEIASENGSYFSDAQYVKSVYFKMSFTN